jgi:RNA polymerase sigma-70 factor (ECF subfamily)
MVYWLHWLAVTPAITASSHWEAGMLLIYLSMLEDNQERNLFEEIYSSNRKLMLKMAGDIVPSGWVEDAAHNAFLRIAKNIEKFFSITCNERRHLCVTIVRNISRDMLRDSDAAKTVYWDESSEPAAEISVVDEILRVERLSDIERCIGMLAPALREVVDLRLVLGYSTSETSALLGITREAVRTRLHRGRMKLQELLIKEGITHG